jgi:BlaI family transcriptional regulator, penicillinase repressor
MSDNRTEDLSRRERQIMDIIYSHGEASAATVLAELPDPPSYSAVRALLMIMVEKDHLKRRSVQGRYIFAPRRRRSQAGRSALRRVLETFYEGSREKALAALLHDHDAKLTSEELVRLQQLIEKARKEGR